MTGSAFCQSKSRFWCWWHCILIRALHMGRLQSFDTTCKSSSAWILPGRSWNSLVSEYILAAFACFFVFSLESSIQLESLNPQCWLVWSLHVGLTLSIFHRIRYFFYSVLRVRTVGCGISAVGVWGCGEQPVSGSWVIDSNLYTALVKGQGKGSLLRLLFLSTSYQAPLGRNPSMLNKHYFTSMSSLKRLLGPVECSFTWF